MFRSLSDWMQARGAVIRLMLAVLVAGLLSSPTARGDEPKRATLESLLIQHGYELIPLKVTAGNSLHHFGKLNGRKVDVYVDTGSPDTCVDTSLTGGLKKVGQLKEDAWGVYGKAAEHPQIVQLDQLELGPTVFTNQSAVVLPMHGKAKTHTGSRIPSSDPLGQIDILLGMDFLQTHHALLLVGAAKLYVNQREPDPSTIDLIEKTMLVSGYALVDLAPYGGCARVSGLANGKQIQLKLDTGASVTNVDGNQLKDLELSAHERIGQSRDVSGKTGDVGFTKIESLRFGEALHDVGLHGLRHRTRARF